MPWRSFRDLLLGIKRHRLHDGFHSGNDATNDEWRYRYGSGARIRTKPTNTAKIPVIDISVRAARGEKTERTPVWLMRHAVHVGFREYSDVIFANAAKPGLRLELSTVSPRLRNGRNYHV
jgi:hypothetical protein